MKLERIIGKEENEKETEVLNQAQKLLDTIDLQLESTKPKPRE